MFRRPGLLAIAAFTLLAACSAQETAESAGEPSATAAATLSADPSAREGSAEETASASPSASAEADSACDLITDAASAPPGSTAGEPQAETLEDFRAEVESQAAGSPGRAAAEANLEAYEAMGLVEQCTIYFGGPANARVSSTALIFEDDSGSAEFLDSVSQGCESGDLPPSATVDATVFVCAFVGFPTVYAAITDGEVVQLASASPGPGGTVNDTFIEQAVDLLEQAIP